MRTALKVVVPGLLARVSSNPLYYTTTFGSLSGWTGATWAVDGSGAYNTPTAGANLLTDPSLEANYTGGRCDTLDLTSSTATLAQSADAHAGSKAQQFTATAFLSRLSFPLVSPGANTFVRYSGWGKRTAGTGNLAKIGLLGTGVLLNTFAAVTAAGYTQYNLTTRVLTSGIFAVYAAREYGNSNFSTIIVDDFAFVVLSGLTLTRQFQEAVATWSAALTVAQGTQAGLRVNMTADKTSYVEAFVSRNDAGTANEQKVYLEKVVSGTRTAINSADITYGAGKVLAITNNGDDTYTVSYDGTPVLSNQAIADAVFDTATYAGPMSTDSSSRVGSFTYDARPS